MHNTVSQSPTLLYKLQLAESYKPGDFRFPDRFVPERWIGHSEYKTDTTDVLRPFHVGPRSCMGEK